MSPSPPPEKMGMTNSKKQRYQRQSSRRWYQDWWQIRTRTICNKTVQLTKYIPRFLRWRFYTAATRLICLQGGTKFPKLSWSWKIIRMCAKKILHAIIIKNSFGRNNQTVEKVSGKGRTYRKIEKEVRAWIVISSHLILPPPNNSTRLETRATKSVVIPSSRRMVRLTSFATSSNGTLVYTMHH